jgi:hypothetical protein
MPCFRMKSSGSSPSGHVGRDSGPEQAADAGTNPAFARRVGVEGDGEGLHPAPLERFDLQGGQFRRDAGDHPLVPVGLGYRGVGESFDQDEV